MTGTKRLAALLLAVFVSALALVGGAASASAKPYPKPPRIVCIVKIVPKFVVKCHLTGYLPNHNIKVTMHTVTVDLGTVKVNGAGTGDVSHQVSPSFAGSTHTVIGQDTTVASDVAQTTVTFPKSSTGGSGTGGQGTGGNGTGGGVSSTGVAVMSIGGAGVLLLAAGGLLLFTGRRRRSLA